MFILSLRGRLGIITAVRLRILSIALTIAILSSSNLELQLTVLAAFLAGSYFTLAQMNKNKQKLTFNSEENREYAYPSLQKTEKWLAYFQWSLAILFFAGCLMLALMDFDEIDTSPGLIFIPFYVGCLALIDVIHRFIR